MTLAARLRAQADELLRIADELDHRAAPQIDGVAVRLAEAPAPTPIFNERRGRRIGIAAAEKISGRSRTSLYRDAKRFGFGTQLPSRGWIFDEEGLRAFLAGSGAIGAVGAAAHIDTIGNANHHRDER